MYPTIIPLLLVSPFNFVGFCFMYFRALFLGALCLYFLCLHDELITFIIIKYSSFLLVTFDLNFILSDISFNHTNGYTKTFKYTVCIVYFSHSFNINPICVFEF